MTAPDPRLDERKTREQHGGHSASCPIMGTGLCDCRPHPTNDLTEPTRYTAEQIEEARRNNEARWRSVDPRLDKIQARLARRDAMIDDGSYKISQTR